MASQSFNNSWGIGFSDITVFQKQYYLHVMLTSELRLLLHTGEKFLGTRREDDPERLLQAVDEVAAAGDPTVVHYELADRESRFPIGGTGFEDVRGAARMGQPHT